MNFFQNRYYKFNAILLTSVGQWPYQPYKWQRIQQIIIHLNIFSVMIVQIIKMIEEWGNVDIMIECVTPMGVQLGACLKSINSMINRRKIKTLIDHIQKDWVCLTNEKEIKILEGYAHDAKNLTRIYAIFLIGSLVMYLLIPIMPQILDVLLPLNESRPLTTLYETEYYFVDSENNYYLIAFHTYTATIMTVFTVVAVDGMYAAYVYHVCGLLAIVGYRLEQTRENINLMKFDANVAIENDLHYRELIICIKKHQDAIKFAVLVESSYSTAFLFQVGVCMLIVSVSMLQLLTKIGKYEEMYRIVQFTFAQFFHLFFNSWPGQKLMNQSAHLSQSIYYAGWYGFSFRSRNLIKFVMMNAAPPLKITAGKLYEMSMENYGSIVQTSISYFTVFASLR